MRCLLASPLITGRVHMGGSDQWLRSNATELNEAKFNEPRHTFILFRSVFVHVHGVLYSNNKRRHWQRPRLCANFTNVGNLLCLAITQISLPLGLLFVRLYTHATCLNNLVPLCESVCNCLPPPPLWVPKTWCEGGLCETIRADTHLQCK